MDEAVGARLHAAHEAIAIGDADTACAHLESLLADHDVGIAHRLLGTVHYFEDRLEDARHEFELAYLREREAGARCSAARCAMVLAELSSGSFGDRALAQGWLARARRLLEPQGACVEWGYLELALVACDRADVDELAQSAERALHIAAEFGDSDLEVRALADSGLALVSQGRHREGFARLDEAMTAIIAGEARDPTVVGTSFCAMLTSCERVGDVRRAEEWMRIVAERMLVPLSGRPRVLHTHCRLAYGAVLSTAGRWPEAEAAILEAVGPGASRSRGHRTEAIARLAELRVHQGRIDEAIELLAPYRDTLCACAPLARVHLERDEPELALGAARRGLRELVGDVTRAAPLLAMLVEAELARGDVDAAARAADELSALAEAVPSPLLLAEAALASGRVHSARLDHAEAVACYAAVLRHLADDVRPLQTGIARRELAEALAATGDAADAVTEARTALATFESLGATAAADRTRALLRRLGAPTTARPPTAGARIGTLTSRETEVLALIREGRTNSEIASRLFISAKTAEHHVGRILTKLGVRSRAEAAAVAAAAAVGDAAAP